MDYISTRSRKFGAAVLCGLFILLACGTNALLTSPSYGQSPAEQPGATETLPAGEALDMIPGSWEGATKVAIVVALFVLPIFLGGQLAKRLRMPEHGWKFAIAIGTIAAALVVVTTGEIKLGPDLSGGITLIYELAADSSGDAASGAAASNPDDSDDASGANPPGRNATRDDDIEALIAVLGERIDPTGTKEVTIRKYGEGQIEIIIPKASQQELEYIERRIYTAGSLVFRITASPLISGHKAIIDIAKRLPPGQDIVRLDGAEAARWVEYNQDEFGSVEEAAASRGLVTRMSRGAPQALVMTDDGLDVTGDYLRSASPDVDETGHPQVSFTFDSQGAFLFGQLTGNHIPTSTGLKYNLGILLDNRLLSAPTIESKITSRGRISGGSMSEDEVNFIVGILKAGRLPAALNKTPISKATVSPTLGAETVEKGKLALGLSLAIVAAFMAWYYRAAGWISVVGLAVNMLLIVACMVLIKAAFTLPGLAGLVLTVGMSVDANVLIYERIREEIKRGAALRMAIRNGFDRATQTIIDSNVTNLITGIVIYKIAPDNVKGFGVTLVLGIAMSIFVAVFLTRIVFDVAERRHWIKSLRMRQFIGETNIDFLGWRRVAIGASLALIAVGLLAVAARRNDLFDIDFTGGSSVTLVLRDDQKMEFPEVMDVLEKSPLSDANLSLVEVGETGTHFTVTTVNDDVAAVQAILTEAFAGKLKTYEVEVSDVVSSAANAPAADAVGARLPQSRFWWGAALHAPLVTALQESATTGGQPVESVDDAADPPAEAARVTEEPQPDGQAVGEADQGSQREDDAAESDNGSNGESSAENAQAEAGPDQPRGDAAAGANADAADETAAAESAELDEGVDPFAQGTSATLNIAGDESAGVSYNTLEQFLLDVLKATGHEGVAYSIENPEHVRGSSRNLSQWTVKLALPEAEAQKVLDQVGASMDGKPIFPLANKIGGRVAKRMATDAIAAVVLCLAGIIGYVWFRFHGVVYGVAAVVALIHDVLVSLGFVALSAYLVSYIPPLASALLIDKFQINLTLVAAFLTIIGYSLNDTIVIFDRIREVKGKSPRLTANMINASVNQCFARTLLTGFTSLISVVVLYFAGGDGIHAFAFSLLTGFVAGIFSTIYIANPVLLWLSERAEATAASHGSKAA